MHFLYVSLLGLASLAATSPTIQRRDGFPDGEPIADASGKGAPILG
jgi:hypothetical protein